MGLGDGGAEEGARREAADHAGGDRAAAPGLRLRRAEGPDHDQGGGGQGSERLHGPTLSMSSAGCSGHGERMPCTACIGPEAVWQQPFSLRWRQAERDSTGPA